VIDKHYNEIGFKAYLAYLKVDKIYCLMTFIKSKLVNRLSGQTFRYDRSDQKNRHMKDHRPDSSLQFFW